MAARSLAMFQRFGGSPIGRWLFSRLVCRQAPYFRTIAPLIEELAPGRCVVRVRDRRSVHNHIGTVHAIALCNAAELAGGLATDATIAERQRWIPKGMTVRYLRKATGTLIATAAVAVPPVDSVAQDAHAFVVVSNAAGEAVFDADITMWISPRA
ncbi:MAG: hotdog fold domain-containing protein [Rudaea sp.]